MLSAKVHSQSVPGIHGFHICGFNQPHIENIQEKKIPESSKKQNLNLLWAGNYIAFTLYEVLKII